MKRFLSLFVFGIVGMSIRTPLSYADENVDLFSKVKTIFHDNCARCHGARSSFNPDDLAGVVAQQDLILAGDADNSPLYQRLILEDGNRRKMPRGGSLLPNEIEAIKTWINNGALVF